MSFDTNWINPSSVDSFVLEEQAWYQEFVRKSEQIEKERNDMPDSALFANKLIENYEWLYKDYGVKNVDNYVNKYANYENKYVNSFVVDNYPF